jgi:glycosyltransferase involved in cell wall biosynthesis
VPEGRVVLYAGSFFDNEGVPTLLDAAPAVLARFPDARFLVVGGHPAEALDELRGRAESLGLSASIRFPGVLPSGEMPLLFRAAAVLVAPKADHVLNRAGVPTKLVEYLASGRPVVASAVGDIPEIVDAGTEALLVPPGDPAALAAAIVGLLADPERARRIGEAGRARVRRDYDVLATGLRIRRELEGA